MQITAENLCCCYGKTEALHQISSTFDSETITAVTGANGSGKSTLLKSLARIVPPSSGKILLNGKNILSFSGNEYAKNVAFLPQICFAPDDFTVERLVACGRFPYLHFFSGLSKYDKQVIERAITSANIQNFRKRLFSSLSGGERQRAALAASIAQEPEILLLDEPTAFLDIKAQMDILNLIKRLKNTLKITVIIAIHDLGLAARFCDKIIVMKNGKLLAEDIPEKIIQPDIIHEAFGIKASVIRSADNIPVIIPH